MTNDTSTLNGALTELGQTMASNLTTQGVTSSASEGLTTLAGKILDIETGTLTLTSNKSTFAVALSGRMSWKDAVGYWVGQVIGGIVAGALLLLVANVVKAPDLTGALGSNGVANAGGVGGAFLVEVIATFLFVLVVLGTTDAKYGAGKPAGLAIGLSLILIHLVCINLTGTSVNPARSIGPALFAGGDALKDLWVFICAPLVGGLLSALVWKGMVPKEK